MYMISFYSRNYNKKFKVLHEVCMCSFFFSFGGWRCLLFVSSFYFRSLELVQKLGFKFLDIKSLFFNLFSLENIPKHSRNFNKLISNPKTSFNHFQHRKSSQIKIVFMSLEIYFFQQVIRENHFQWTSIIKISLLIPKLIFLWLEYDQLSPLSSLTFSFNNFVFPLLT